ncbi:MAG: hypothetical protein M3N07_01065 [Pseudomonadota bacterium]|nr:hypothetical protein [Pseudomonadota bacterium]
MRGPLRLVAVAVAVAAATGAAAQVLIQPDAAMVAMFDRMARDNLTLARLPDGTNVPPETAEERAQPIVPPALTEQTVRRGFLSGEMQACGLDPMQSFLPYMAALRASGHYSDRQLAYVGLLHGLGQGFAHSELSKAVRSCSRGILRRLQRTASRQPILTP